MKTFKISISELKNYLINRAFLVKKADSIRDVLNYYSCVQVDPTSVVAKNQELVLWNRVNNFKRKELENELYKNRNYFEYWLQLYSIIPKENYPYLQARRNIKNSWQEEFYKKYKKQILTALKFIKENGPTSSKELSHIKGARNLFSWNNKESQKALLDYLWDKGKILITFRKNNRKYYDLSSRVIGKKLADKRVTQKESLEFITQSSFNYLGVLRKEFLNRAGYFSKLGIKNSFINSGIVELEIPSVKTRYYILEEQIPEINKLKKDNLHEKLNIFAPLDPLIIDRKMIEDIFNFYYRWEAYLPKKKRKFGHFGMPILYEGNFIGQIDLKKDKKRKLQVNNLELVKRTKRTGKLLDEEIAKLENFVQT